MEELAECLVEEEWEEISTSDVFLRNKQVHFYVLTKNLSLEKLSLQKQNRASTLRDTFNLCRSKSQLMKFSLCKEQSQDLHEFVILCVTSTLWTLSGQPVYLDKYRTLYNRLSPLFYKACILSLNVPVGKFVALKLGP
ncbi:unnamed protein product [Sphenostylis stenocarpa]|uniref:Uncharacterized protein n=1 Tax=Sphenostylis stenocarpa TaxID=92480 RepID=A0AA86V3T7_9FABA|nr:unnamed protein product [Sphenostylis stenocarpa]